MFSWTLEVENLHQTRMTHTSKNCKVLRVMANMKAHKNRNVSATIRVIVAKSP